MIVHFFVILRNLHALSMGAVPIYNLTNSVLFPFLTFLSNACYLLSFLILAIQTAGRSYLMVALICLSVMFNDVEHLFTCLLVMCVTSSKILIQVFFPFLNWILWFFFNWFIWCLYMYCILTWYFTCKYLPPLSSLSFRCW